MEEYVSFHKVLDLLQYFQENNPRLNSFGYGNLVDFGKNVSGTTVEYPFLFIVPLSIQYDENTTTYQVTAIFADRLNETLDNEKDCVSDMSLCARDLLSQIKRGDLFDYFETILPAQAQPFMERFNDNVAGVALDLYIQIFEDINACVQYPTPTPSNTPNLTPSLTPTNTVTPSITPTNTPTPSITPTNTVTPTVTTTPFLTPTQTPSSTPGPVNPSTLGALWWIDFTDVSTLTFGFGNMILQARDKISSVPFNSPNGPIWSPAYLSVSGAVIEGVTQLTNTLGTYTTPFSGWTWFAHMFDNPATQGGGKIFNFSQGDDPIGPNQAGHFQDDLGSPGIAGWRSRSVSNDVSFLNVSQNPTLSAWTFVAIRAYQDGADMKLDFYENGSIVQTGTLSSKTMKILTDAKFNLMYDGGIDYVTEQFFFSRKLTDSEMTQAFTYLNNKY